MTEEERSLVLVTARLLRAAARAAWAFTVLIAMSVLIVFLDGHATIPSVAAIALGLTGEFFHFRIAFDASLFEDAAAGNLTKESLDGALASLNLVPPGKRGRPWPARCQGARRLVKIVGFLMIAQCCAFLLAGRWLAS